MIPDVKEWKRHYFVIQGQCTHTKTPLHKQQCKISRAVMWAKKTRQRANQGKKNPMPSSQEFKLHNGGSKTKRNRVCLRVCKVYVCACACVYMGVGQVEMFCVCHRYAPRERHTAHPHLGQHRWRAAGHCPAGPPPGAPPPAAPPRCPPGSAPQCGPPAPGHPAGEPWAGQPRTLQ